MATVKLEFSGRTVVSGMKKTGFRDGKGGSIGQIPKDWVQRTTLIELDQEKNQFRGRNVGKRGSRYQRLGSANDVN